MNGPTEGYTLSGVALAPPPRKLKLLPLVAATYFMVAGGPYGLEDVVQKSGYPGTIGLLEFWPLVALRVCEPGLPRPYRVPGGLPGAVALGIGPLALIVATVLRNRTEQVGPVSSLTLGLALIAAGPLVYFFSHFRALAKRIRP